MAVRLIFFRSQYDCDRYHPTGWTHVGDFEAKDEKVIQSFTIGNEEIFAKFVKVEILSHYGSEHFCPISLFKVLGTSVVEVYERETRGEDLPDVADEPEPGFFVSIED